MSALASMVVGFMASAMGAPDPTEPRYVAAEPFGRSAHGRILRVEKLGRPDEARRVLVFGCIHGDECAGTAVTRSLLRGKPPTEADVWVVHNLNPDGRRLGTRLNGRGVDLNRNFASGWRPIGQRWDPQYSGPRPVSEPETRAARRLISRFRPHVTVWFHQQAERLVRAWGESVPAAHRYARVAQMPFHELPWLAGTAPNWQNHRFRATASFVVELPFGRPSRRAVQRNVRAIRTLARIR